MPETVGNCGERIEEIGCEEDMISALPDDLLLSILIRLPIKDAVATMFLSKRWLYTWTMMHALDYEENNDDESKKSVWFFLEKSLQLNKAPVLQLFSIELGPRCPSDADVGKYVAKAVDRGVIVLNLCLLLSGEPTSLPMTLYSCVSLKVLTLCDKILVDVPSTACLPLLEILNLSLVVYKNEDSLIRLLSSCPVLMNLLVNRNKVDNVRKFTVKVPSLLELIYTNNYPSRDDSSTAGGCLVVDTPVLNEFYYTDYSGDSCFIENAPCFDEVSIDFDNVIQSFPDIDKFLKSFSRLLFLELALTDAMMMSWRTIKFSRLRKCKIHPYASDWMDSLLCFLHNTPKLTSLIVCYNLTDEPRNASTSWSESRSDPECLSSVLKYLRLRNYTGREEEKELVEYILSTSKCLKTATISFRSLPKFELEDKATMMEELKAIPRVSKTSQLLFKT
ncbi:putative FBD-associated F-box protein At1g05080 [Capsella rubella]|uniref:putative FBD-associated F-box protein At1g05080 n=1 Tax=Capsella rubella TaxID=81985 RepID=UPI000CD4ACCC|nr:putative FBD-associated F-box protein At1g05080 [Capsella rubella]